MYPYKAHNEKCMFEPSKVAATVSDVVNITSVSYMVMLLDPPLFQTPMCHHQLCPIDKETESHTHKHVERQSNHSTSSAHGHTGLQY